MKTIAILALASTAAAFAAEDTAALVQGPDRKLRTDAQEHADVNHECHTANDGYIQTLKAGEYTASKFYNCFRTSEQIFEYVDELAKQNPTLLTKEAISTTVHNKTIYAYKLTSGTSKPTSLYFQSLIHAHEWNAGSSNLFTLSSILDAIANGNETAADLYNLYFVPIVNIDGYDISWNGNRLQRKNANEVDLNRNWPTPFKNPNPPAREAEDYPGPSPFSEPETKGIDEWLHAKNSELAGWVNFQSNSGAIWYPYGDTKERIGNGEDEKFKLLGYYVSMATGAGYRSRPKGVFGDLEFGRFEDYVYRTYKKPVFTIEVSGGSNAPASTIRTTGTEIFNALSRFAEVVGDFDVNSTAC
ncbi:hypothetical protein DYB37_010810 [Aphanomyces astaci]|uniref:Peptidase M14 domain-containing protein n=1 Tax=Aphanomyces astaci TaxID=112090 RepID=A0A418DRM5_APHAT|nr:hypothetical protein DYB35_011017 [Aphanomyces astaci]RHZ27794.1 hypothetical protein DYB37_010810 [Aphanomyces astaci]